MLTFSVSSGNQNSYQSQRLESEAATQTCNIAEATRDLLDDSVEVGELKYIKVKGKKIPVGVCQLMT
jgi:class 3 adenylate cyclase